MPNGFGYQYDIFISYCHSDNESIGDKPGWIDSFHKSLENWLKGRRRLSDLKIWRDESRMTGSTVFDDAIKDAINKSALFFALHSRNYPDSDYCQKELNWFHEYNSKRPGGLRIGNDLRIFNILLNNIPHAEWPDTLGQKTSGFPMHDAESNDKRGEFTSPSDYQFEKQLRKIVDAAEKILTEIKPVSILTPASPESTQSVQVFVADVADSLQDLRERVVTEVKDKEAHVFDEIPPPMESVSHAEKVKEVQSHSQLSIHLLDKWPGRKIRDNRETSYSKEQLQIALKSGSRKLIWVPGDLNIEAIEDRNQKELLDTLANRERQNAEYEFVHGPFTDFLAAISQKIDDLTPSPDGTAPKTFLIDTHQKDQRYAYKLADCLADRDVDVEFNKESHDPNISLAEFENSVKKAKNLIIVFGKVSKEWLEARIKKALKTFSEQLEGPITLENIWIYITPSCVGTPDLPKFPPLIKISILDNSQNDAFDPGLINNLLSNPGGDG